MSRFPGILLLVVVFAALNVVAAMARYGGA